MNRTNLKFVTHIEYSNTASILVAPAHLFPYLAQRSLR